MTEPYSNENNLMAVFQAQHRFWAALKGKDRQAFEHLLADDFIARSPGQPNQNRVAFIDTLTSFPAQVLSVGSVNLEVHVWGTIAVVTGVQSAQTQLADGKGKEDRIAIPNIFEQQEGRWLLKLSYAISMD